MIVTRKCKVPKSELVHGAYYIGHCRNSEIARWNAITSRFVYRRHTFGHEFLEEIHHSEDYCGYDVFIVESLLEHAPEQEIYLK